MRFRKALSDELVSYSFESDDSLFGATHAHNVSVCSDAMSRKNDRKYCLVTSE